MEIKLISMVLFLIFMKACRTSKINKVLVPSYYLEDSSSEELILNCDFEIGENEMGFVLKWHHNSVPIYQWIPQKKPYALNHFKDRINTEYSSSDEKYKKYSALAIKKPSITDTGNYTCDVQTFQSSDKKGSQMIVIHPQNSINLKYTIDESEQIVNFECSVFNIYPFPEVKFLFDDEEKNLSTDVDYRNVTSLYNVTITAQVSKNDIRDESLVTCLMKINDTDYERKESIIYDDPKQTSTSKISIDGENMLASELSNENHGTISKPHLGVSIIILINMVYGHLL
ncbi:unnamed protein product [Chironomus riparius]|uniref:Ig-like domain-containing protein n=1 Tax=Chironomus riparius TaxID=315576 RepID=A0A9N9WPI3_9DIPT|nr:unnamed protein product [Chironomus riparius]